MVRTVDVTTVAELMKESPELGGAEEEVQADCVCIVYPGVCYRGRRRRCKLTVFV